MSDLPCPTTLLLVRHGEAEYESDRWADAGGSLTATGRAQAAALAAALVARRPAHVWSSTMARAVQTAEILAATLGLGVTTREGLREFEVGDAAGTTKEVDPFAPTFAAWMTGDLAARMPGAESGLELRDRVRSALEEVAGRHRGETVVVLTHGGVIRALVPALTRMRVEPARVDCCGVVEVEADDAGWVCTAWRPGPSLPRP